MMFEDGPRWFAAGMGRGRVRRVRRHGGGDGGDREGLRQRRRAMRGLMDEQAPRVERGGVRYLVLDAIAETPRHGYEIMQAVDEKSGGAYRPSPGVTYPTLQMLEDVGHVRISERDGKKVYAITAAGTRDLEEHRDDVARFYEHAADLRADRGGDTAELVGRVRRLVRAFRRAARRGRLTAAQTTDVKKTLDEAIAKLEALVD